MARRPKLPKNVSRFVDRHGRERYRYRSKGRSVYLRGALGSAEFDQSLEAARGAGPEERFGLGTVDHVLTHFYRSTTFRNAGADRQARVRGILERFRKEYGRFKVAEFEFDIIEQILLDESEKRKEGKRTVGGKVAALSLHKQLKRVFDHAIKLKLITVNPAKLAKGVKQDKGGFHTWTEEEIFQYRKTHPLGTKARLYLEIILWTWKRRGDAHRFGPKHMIGDRIKYTQEKTKKELSLPAAPQLIAAIRAMPAIGMTTFLVTDYGKPFSKDGIGNKMREWCDQAGLPDCSAHGVRKAAARRAAELGGTNQQLKSVGGWSQDQEVSLYTEAANQAGLALDIITRISEWDAGLVR